MAMPKLDFEAVKDFQAAGASEQLAQAIVRYKSKEQIDQLAIKASLDSLRAELAGIQAGMAQLATKTELVEIRAGIAQLATKNELIELRVGIAPGDYQ